MTTRRRSEAQLTGLMLWLCHRELALRLENTTKDRPGGDRRDEVYAGIGDDLLSRGRY